MAQADQESERTMIRRSATAAPAPQVAHVMLLRQDGKPPRRIALGDGALRIGRGPQNDLVLPSPDVSRQHCWIGLAGGSAVVTDLESTNGVHVDGDRVTQRAVLYPGAWLAVGPFALQYQRGSPEELAEAVDREHELARAVNYIQALLPPPLREGAVRAEWRFVPSAQLGGDAFGYRWLDDRRFAVFLLDVSGHGVGSALLAASAANMLRARSLGAADPADPVAVLAALNAAFQMDDQSGLFFSMWYGVFDAADRTLRFASAGHHPGFLAPPGGAPVPLATRGPAIGMAPGARFRGAESAVPPGSRLYLFSDGAFEVTLDDGRDGTIGDFVALLGSTPGADELFQAVRALTGRRPFQDDVSIMALAFP